MDIHSSISASMIRYSRIVNTDIKVIGHLFTRVGSILDFEAVIYSLKQLPLCSKRFMPVKRKPLASRMKWLVQRTAVSSQCHSPPSGRPTGARSTGLQAPRELPGHRRCRPCGNSARGQGPTGAASARTAPGADCSPPRGGTGRDGRNETDRTGRVGRDGR